MNFLKIFSDYSPFLIHRLPQKGFWNFFWSGLKKLQSRLKSKDPQITEVQAKIIEMLLFTFQIIKHNITFKITFGGWFP